ncbi:fimbrial protein [Escherichia coli]|uniref:Fimbrial protein n=1 Tax=Escherichia coli TaxID=562 RepID=A0A376TVE5_ECOLX|nr:fimbrial protein [Escherichia coli]
MKKWTIIFASLMLLVLSVVGASKSYAGDKLMSASFDSVRVYYAMDKVTGAVASSVFNVTVITPKEVAYGKYDSFAYKGDTLRVISWSGSGSAPTLVLTDFDTINNSNCPGIDTKIFRCAYKLPLHLMIMVALGSHPFIPIQIYPDLEAIRPLQCITQYAQRYRSLHTISPGVKIMSAIIRRYEFSPRGQQ